jgi:hypothetical protein
MKLILVMIFLFWEHGTQYDVCFLEIEIFSVRNCYGCFSQVQGMHLCRIETSRVAQAAVEQKGPGVAQAAVEQKGPGPAQAAVEYTGPGPAQVHMLLKNRQVQRLRRLL